jgi:hypothetical protein
VTLLRRGVERNEAWLNRRVAALNLRRLVVLGLTRSDDTCGRKTYQRGRFTPPTLALRCGLIPEEPRPTLSEDD